MERPRGNGLRGELDHTAGKRAHVMPTVSQLVGSVTIQGASQATSDLQKVNQAQQQVASGGGKAASGIDQMNQKAKEGTGIFANLKSNIMAGVGAALGFAGINLGATGVFDFLKDTINAASQLQSIMTQTNSVLKSTSDVSGLTAQQVHDMADSISEATGVSDQNVQSAQNLLLTYTNISGKALPDVTNTVLDMATALNNGALPSMGQLDSISRIVGRALQDPAKGMSMLTREGVTLSASQQALVKKFEAAGNMAGAQGVILDALNKKYGGSADAAGNTFAGALGKLGTAFDHIKEEIGGPIITVLTQLMGKVTPLIDAFGKVLPQVIDQLTKILQPVLDTMQGMFQKLLPIVTQTINTFQQRWMPVFGDVVKQITTNVVPAVRDIIAEIMTQLVPAAMQLFDAISPNLLPALNNIGSIIHGVVAPALELVIGVMSRMVLGVADVVKAANGIARGWAAAAGNIKNTVTGMLHSIVGGINQVIMAINDFIISVNGMVIQVPSITLPGGQVVGGQAIHMPFTPALPFVSVGGVGGGGGGGGGAGSGSTSVNLASQMVSQAIAAGKPLTAQQLAQIQNAAAFGQGDTSSAPSVATGGSGSGSGGKGGGGAGKKKAKKGKGASGSSTIPTDVEDVAQAGGNAILAALAANKGLVGNALMAAIEPQIQAAAEAKASALGVASSVADAMAAKEASAAALAAGSSGHLSKSELKQAIKEGAQAGVTAASKSIATAVTQGTIAATKQQVTISNDQIDLATQIVAQMGWIATARGGV